MSEYCLKPCATNENIMFVHTRDSTLDDVFSAARSPKRLCLDLENRDAGSNPGSPLCLPMDGSKRPLQDVTLRCSSSNNSGSPSPSPPYPDSPGTPTRPGDCVAGRPEPLTPTARLKLLSSLADRLPYASGDNSMDEELSNHSSNSENTKPVSRKDKSLGLLCQAFLALYPEYASPSDNIIVSLDEAARVLGVERRRVYDIVNVLESVGMVAKEAKNKYRWFGKGALWETLPKLKALSEKSNMAAQIHTVKDFEFSHSLEMSQLFVVPSNEAINQGQASVASMPENAGFLNAFLQDAELRREKSMGIMSQRFLMLFLTSPPRTVSLDLAAKVLIGDPTVDKTQSLVYKTKIRRLYDIANILSSLNLIRKVTVTEARGRKSAFKYIGPDIGSAGTEEVSQIQPQSRHSLVATIGSTFKASGKTKVLPDEPIKLSPSSNTPNPDGCTAQVLELLQTTQVDHPKRGGSRLTRTQSDDLSAAGQKGRRKWRGAAPFARASSSSSAKPLARHSSFHDICEVAEMERRRLYSAEEDNRVDALIANTSGAGVVASEAAQPTLEGGAGVTSSDEGVSSCAVEQATPDTTSETGAATATAGKESHVITLSAEQYMKLLQSLNLPVHSKPIISIQQEEEAKGVETPPLPPSCNCTAGQQQLEPPTEPAPKTEPVPQMAPAPQAEPVPKTEPEPVLKTDPTPQLEPMEQQAMQPVQQAAAAMLAPPLEMSAAILTPTFQIPNWFIEQRREDLRTPCGSDSSVDTAASAAVLPAAARKLTYDSAPTTPVSPALTSEASSSSPDNSAAGLPTTATVTPITPNYYACFFRGATPSPEVVPLMATAPTSTSSSVSPQIPIFSPSNCMLALSPVVLGAAPNMRAMSAIAIPAGTRFITTSTPAAAPPQTPTVEKKTAARKLTLTK